MKHCAPSCANRAPQARSRRGVKFRDRPHSAVHERCTRTVMRAHARRIELLDNEIDNHDRALRELLDAAAPKAHRRTRHRLHHRGAVLPRLVNIPAAATAKPPSLALTASHRSPPPPQPVAAAANSTRPLPRGHHQAALRPGHPRLHHPSSRRRQNRTRSPPVHQTLPRPPRLATPRTPENHCLTNLEASPWRDGGVSNH
jgi:hypothetical protein